MFVVASTGLSMEVSMHTCPLSKALVGVLGLRILMDGNLVCYCME